MADNAALLQALQAAYKSRGMERTADMLIHEALSQLLFKVDRGKWYEYQKGQETGVNDEITAD